MHIIYIYIYDMSYIYIYICHISYMSCIHIYICHLYMSYISIRMYVIYIYGYIPIHIKRTLLRKMLIEGTPREGMHTYRQQSTEDESSLGSRRKGSATSCGASPRRAIAGGGVASHHKRTAVCSLEMAVSINWGSIS